MTAFHSYERQTGEVVEFVRYGNTVKVTIDGEAARERKFQKGVHVERAAMLFALAYESDDNAQYQQGLVDNTPKMP
ncbi:MAG: hypothetical protein ACR2M1_08475 [Gemmatimonadaceae bacterium]